MKENLVCCLILKSCLSLVITTGAGNQYQPECCHRIAVSNQGPGEDGYYRLKQIMTGLPEFCVGGCVYYKEDSSQPDQEFCFYQTQVEEEVSQCLVTTTTTTSSSSSSSSFSSSSLSSSQLSTTTTGSPTTNTASIEKDISMLSHIILIVCFKL